jgi:putative restriction endonuclease
MALRRLCQWAFDQGLLGVSGKCLLLLSGEVRSAQNMAGYLLTLENRSIIGPEESESVAA